MIEEYYKHTFAILAYKESPYVEECILSLKRQKVKSKLYISTSTPSSFLNALSKKYDIPILINDKSDGIASDWTFAYNNTATNYVTLAHQDDIYLPDYSEQCLRIAERYKNNLITFTDYCEFINEAHKNLTLNLLIKKVILSLSYLHKDNLNSSSGKKIMFALGNPISCPSVMFNREKIGYFEFSKQFEYNLDWDAWIRLSQMQGDFIYLKKKLIFHRIHEDSELVVGTKARHRQREDKIFFKRYWPSPFAEIILKIYSLSYRNYLNVKR